MQQKTTGVWFSGWDMEAQENPTWTLREENKAPQ